MQIEQEYRCPVCGEILLLCENYDAGIYLCGADSCPVHEVFTDHSGIVQVNLKNSNGCIYIECKEDKPVIDLLVIQPMALIGSVLHILQGR